MNPGTAGNLCTAVEAANLKDRFQASAGTNYMVYRKSVLKVAVMLILLRLVLQVFSIKSSTDTAHDVHGGTLVLNAQVPADCFLPCASTASDVAKGVNQLLDMAVAVSFNSSSDLAPHGLGEVELSALTTCLGLCVGARTTALPMQLAAGSICRLDVNASVISGDTIVLCDQKESPSQSTLEYRLALIDLTQKAVATALGMVYMSLIVAASVSWRHFQSSMRCICLAVFATLAQPYIVSVVPWYDLFRLGEVLSDSPVYEASPSLADFRVRSQVMIPVFLSLQSGLMALFPALSKAVVTAKTIDSGNPFVDALLAGVPVFLFTFNWPIWALIYQATGSVLLLVGGLLFSGSHLIFTCYFKKIAFLDDTAATVSLLKTVTTRHLALLFVAVILIAAGAFLQFWDITEALLDNLVVTPVEVLNFVADYWVQFYVSYIAAADVLVFGLVHFGNKMVSISQLNDEAAGLADSYSALTCEEAVFRGGRSWRLFPFPV